MCDTPQTVLDESDGLRYNSTAFRAGATPARLIEQDHSLPSPSPEADVREVRSEPKSEASRAVSRKADSIGQAGKATASAGMDAWSHVRTRL